MLAPDERVYFDEWLAEQRGGATSVPPPPAEPCFIALAAATRAGEIARTIRRATSTGRAVPARAWAEVEQQCAEGEAEMRIAKRAARAAKEAAQ